MVCSHAAGKLRSDLDLVRCFRRSMILAVFRELAQETGVPLPGGSVSATTGS